MNVGLVVILFLLATVISSLLSRVVPGLPRPLVQIALGAAIGALSPWNITLDPHLFFLMIVPPLLFYDGWRLPSDDLARDAPTVLSLALVLVFATVVAIGLLIHTVVPQLPLPVAFALAAAISPTDPVSVSAITSRVPMPRRLMTVLQGEALLNDSVGLVCFKFAVAAIASGGFSIWQAGGEFLWLSCAGVGIGVAVTWLSIWLTAKIDDHLGADAGSTALITVLIPFGAYIAAEHVAASGVLAAASSGLSLTLRHSAKLGGGVHRLERRAIWNLISYTLNGAVFVLLGEQLPRLLERGLKVSGSANLQGVESLVVKIGLILIALYAVRLIVLGIVFGVLPAWRNLRAGEAGPKLIPLLVSMTVASPRGALTLAAILTLPATSSGAISAETRDLAILVAAVVIVATTTLTGLLLPVCLRWLDWSGAGSPRDDLREIEVGMAEAALSALEDARSERAKGMEDTSALDAASGEIMQIYQRRLDSLHHQSDAEDRQAAAELRRDLHRAALEAERQFLKDQRNEGEITVSQAVELDRRIDLESAIKSRR
ncbi:Na+/H+ antiporter [Rhodobacterales bacterium]|nr:Na+/H+ antiporter [Rhodobacterales bacterium]